MLITGRANRSDRNMPGGTDPARIPLPTRATDTARQTNVTANPISRTDNRPATAVSTRTTTSWAGATHGVGPTNHRQDTARSRGESGGVCYARATITDQAQESQTGPRRSGAQLGDPVSAGSTSRVREAQTRKHTNSESEVRPAGASSWELQTRSA